MSKAAINIVELGVGRCPLVYGQAPCSAAGAVGSECYNTRDTCQDVANYTESQDGQEAFSRTALAIGLDAVVVDDEAARTTQIPAYRFPGHVPDALPPVTDNSEITLAELYAEVADIAQAYGAYDDVMGQSVQGRDLHCLRLFDSGERPIVLIVCGTHGDEVASVRGWLAAIRWVLTSSSKLAAEFRDTCALYFVPSHNPDGHVNGTRRNAADENLNRNWPYFWDVASDWDKGTAPLSAPECAALAGYMDSYGRAARLLVCIDAHGWSSRNTWGFLTEQIYHTTGCRDLQRGILNCANSIIRRGGYSAVNGPVELREYRSKRKPYLYTWMVNKGRDDCWGGIIEFPEAESAALNSTVAQDIFVGLVQAVVDHLQGGQLATIVESGVKSDPSNNNSDLTAWNSTEPRPNWMRYSRLRLSQVFDNLLQRNVCESHRPAEVQLPEARYGGASVALQRVDGHVDGWIIAGYSAGFIAETDRYNGESGSISAQPDLPVAAYYPAAASDGATIYSIGGYSGSYVSAIYAHVIDGAGWDVLVDRLIINGGVQRHAAVWWDGLLIYAGGRNAAGYLTNIVAVNPVTKHQYTIAHLSNARGWMPAALNGDNFYTFGGWSGSLYYSYIDKITLADNLVGAASDGEVEVVNGTPTGDFLSTNHTFSAADVGRNLTIQCLASDGSYPAGVGEYQIAAFVDAGRVTLSSAPADAGAGNVGLEFTVTTPPPVCTMIGYLPAVRRQMALAQNGNVVYLFGGTSNWGVESELYRYDMASDTVTEVTYTLDSWVDDYGVTQTVEEPVLRSAHMFYDAVDNVLTIAGGQDEALAPRDQLYQISLDDLVCVIINSDAAAYGYLRSSSKFDVVAGEKYMLVASVRNMHPRNDFKNPYVRLVARFGPLSGYTRYQRTWYSVPTRDEYYTILMPIEVRASDGDELRIYLRHYSAETTVRFAHLQLLPDREQLTLPVIAGNLVEDSREFSFPGGLLLSSQFDLVGSFVPLLAANADASALPLLLFKDVGGAEVMQLSFVDSNDPASNSANNGVYRCTFTPSGYSQDLPAFDVNYNRSSGKEHRGDVVHWTLETKGGGLSLLLYHCGSVRQFDVDLSSVAAIASVEQLNGVHSDLSLTAHSPYQFCDAPLDVPRGTQLLPVVRRVRHTPSVLYLGGGLGKRASLDVSISDFGHHDRGIDPYAAGRPYDTSQGTFFGKFLARHPYYAGRPLLHNGGVVVNGQLQTDQRRYVITDISGPSAGTVKVTAKDLLKMLDEDRARCPQVSRGYLQAAVGQDLTPFAVLGGGEYDDAGVIRIGSELIRYTRIGELFTPIERGVGGSETSDHKAAADVQQAAELAGNVVDVVRQLMVDFGGVDPEQIPDLKWLAEKERWLLGVDVYAIISKPEGVGKLLNELCKSCMVHVGWDELDQQVMLKAVVPISDDAVPVVDEGSYIDGSLKITPSDKERVTEVWFSYAPANQTKPGDYSNTYVKADLVLSGEYLHGDEKVKHIKSRWFQEGAQGVVAQVAARYLSWFKVRPVYADFRVLLSWQTTLRAGALFDLSVPDLQGVTGARNDRRMQVLSVSPVVDDGELAIKAVSVGGESASIDRYCRIMADGADYPQSTISERTNGGFISPESGEMSDGGLPYLIL